MCVLFIQKVVKNTMLTFVERTLKKKTKPYWGKHKRVQEFKRLCRDNHTQREHVG